MESQQFVIRVKTVITQIFEDIKSIYANSKNHNCYIENKGYNYKLFLHTKATDWNNFKERTNLYLHLRIDPRINKLVIEEHNSDYDLELELLRAGITENEIYDSWLEDEDPRIYFTGFQS